jgi:hypothetical protein
MRLRALPIFLIGLCLGCASRSVTKGALTAEERQEYVEQTGALIPQRLKDPFVAGIAAEGMTKEMIAFIYGQPDRTEANRYGITWGSAETDPAPNVDSRDSIWNYFGIDSVSIRRGMLFRGDTLAKFSGDAAR